MFDPFGRIIVRLWLRQNDRPLVAGVSCGVVGHHLLEGIVFCQGLALPVGTMHRYEGKTGQALFGQPGRPGTGVHSAGQHDFAAFGKILGQGKGFRRFQLRTAEKTEPAPG